MTGVVSYGFVAVIKVLLSFENGTIPANLHYKEPNPNSESLKNGTLKVCHGSFNILVYFDGALNVALCGDLRTFLLD